MATQNTSVYDAQNTHNTTRASGQSMLPLQSTIRVFKVRHTLTSAMVNTELINLGFPNCPGGKLLPHLSRVSVIAATGFNASVLINRVPLGTGTPVALTAATANNVTSVALTPITGFDTPVLVAGDLLTAVLSAVTTAALGAILEFELAFDTAGQP